VAAARRKLILTIYDLQKYGYFVNYSDYERRTELEALPRGISNLVTSHSDGNPDTPRNEFAFVYYYWSDSRGYVECTVRIITDNHNEFVKDSDLNIEETEKVLFSYNKYKLNMDEFIQVPEGKLAGEDAAARRRRELRERLQQGKTVNAAPGGKVVGNDQEATIEITTGKLAGEDAAARRRRELRERLQQGQTVQMTQKGGTMSNNPNEVIMNAPGGKLAGEDAAARKCRELRERLQQGKTVNAAPIEIPKGKLAAQWYETNPTLLTMEKMSMARNFPQFELETLDDGRLCWVGTLEPGVYESKFGRKMEYHVMAVYDNNHPFQKMGSSVKVYPMMPDVDELIEMAGFRPFHLLRDEVDNLYLCTNEAGDQKVGQTTTTAASVLGWAVKWLTAFELVLTGDLPLADFNRHGGI